MKNIAIIPARSGSKGLLDKNIKLLLSKPLIYYSIQAAIKSELFDTVMVSTDSEKYALIAKENGAEVPFLRSPETSSDSASSWGVVFEVLKNYERQGEIFDTFCFLQPTSPLRNADDIIEAYRIFEMKKAFAVVSVTDLEHPLEWCGTLGADNSLNGFIKRGQGEQRQKTTAFYRPNGAIYIVDINNFKKDSFLYRENSYAYIMPKERSVDIDTEFDFRYAEFLMGCSNNIGNSF